MFYRGTRLFSSSAGPAFGLARAGSGGSRALEPGGPPNRPSKVGPVRTQNRTPGNLIAKGKRTHHAHGQRARMTRPDEGKEN